MNKNDPNKNGSAPLFVLDKVSVTHDGVPILRKISLSIPEGARIALIGPSGAGKSTLLSELYKLGNKNISLVPQELGLVRNLTVFHNIYMGRLQDHGNFYNLINLIRPMRGEIENMQPIVNQLGLSEKLFSPTFDLSGGQQQRTAVGRAIYKDSPIFFGDEPVSAVDEYQSHAVLSAIVDQHQTVILAMHDVKLALKYTDRVIGLKNGLKVLDQSTKGIRMSDLEALYKE
ncbi:MAG: ATP-binding cassette domain-containing protein [Pseudomonadota bacterium]|nr:ATP-binding cassette domain-containing protein [Pseudomonadota bacterium]